MIASFLHCSVWAWLHSIKWWHWLHWQARPPNNGKYFGDSEDPQRNARPIIG